ncbi:MAG: hypothetical protein M5U26_02310 [Planctomycetota bacterium]|nr:hypothetical protein [Planctomycetota bacterium]
MEQFKYAVFGMECPGLSDALLLIDPLAEAFQASKHAQSTLFQSAQTLEQAAAQIDEFKAKTCGSAYNFAVLNLNLFNNTKELQFLMSGRVLGNPRTIFCGTMRMLDREIYAMAREKVDQEMDLITASKSFAAPSCIVSYTEATRDEAVQTALEVLGAYLDEQITRERQRQTSTILPGAVSPALDYMRRSTSIFYGRKGRISSARIPAVGRRDPANETGIFERPRISSRRLPPQRP